MESSGKEERKPSQKLKMMMWGAGKLRDPLRSTRFHQRNLKVEEETWVEVGESGNIGRVESVTRHSGRQGCGEKEESERRWGGRKRAGRGRGTGRWGEGMMLSNVLCCISLCQVPLTIAFEKPVEGSLFAPPTEFLSLVHQCLLDRLLSTQHHNSARSQVDGEYRTITLADLMEVDDERS